MHSHINKFINDIIKAWAEGASDAEFAGMTLAQYKTKVKPSLDYRAEIETLDTQTTLARQNRNNSDEVSNEVSIAVVNGVKAHPEYGENSAVYKAMGYVPKNDRKSGLVRPSDNQQPSIKAA